MGRSTRPYRRAPYQAAWLAEALQRAAVGGHVAVVELLVDGGRACVAAQDNAALVGAIEWGHADVCRALLARGARVCSRAVQAALTYRRPDVVSALLEAAAVPAGLPGAACRDAVAVPVVLAPLLMAGGGAHVGRAAGSAGMRG